MVGRSRDAKGIARTLGSGRRVMVDHPRASDQGTWTCDILTLPDSVRRRPTLFQLYYDAR
jgi:hypothetical protein